jgi:RimJ/RimL family protein N-acetyltransferase
VRLYGDPRVAGALFPGRLGGPRTAAGARELLREQIDQWDENGFDLWWWRCRASGELVARGGLRRTIVAGREEVEVGWAVSPDHWGKGVATELAGASIAYAFGPLGLREVVSFTLAGNRASQRVMEKSGMRLEGRIEHVGLPHLLYRLDAEAALAARP